MATRALDFPRSEIVYTRRIITSVDLMRAAAGWPFSRRISRTASDVIIEVICCPAIDKVTCAMIPSTLMSTIRPMS